MRRSATFCARCLEIRYRPGMPPDTALRASAHDLARLLDEHQGVFRHRAQDLALRLKGCCETVPCRSAACPVCSADRQALELAKLERLWPPDDTPLITTSIILRKHERVAGKLSSLQPSSVVQGLRRKLKEAGCQRVPIWGYVDYSWNTHAGGEYAPHHCPHAHIITKAKYRPMLRSVRELLKPSTSLKRPMRIDDIRNWDAQASYAGKPGPTHRRDFPKTSKNARPSKYPLTIPDRLVEFALWVGDKRPEDRHFAFNLRKC